jgi:hypothetical protein
MTLMPWKKCTPRQYRYKIIPKSIYAKLECATGGGGKALTEVGRTDFMCTESSKTQVHGTKNPSFTVCVCAGARTCPQAHAQGKCACVCVHMHALSCISI